jgi:hypothetical protein
MITITADMTAEESKAGIYVCKIAECEDDGAMMPRNQDGEVMNVFLEDYGWRTDASAEVEVRGMRRFRGPKTVL